MSVCQKRSYITKAEAKAALASAMGARERGGQTRRKEIRFYRCPSCKTYHLTSHETI